jgi:ABC-2 type transport system ATP-binding protein
MTEMVVHDGPSPSGPTAVIDGLSKWFGNVVAVSDVSAEIRPGVTALLGPNGAGKSTLFRVLCGLTPPSKGTVTVLGSDPRRDREVRARIGLVPQQDALFERLRALPFVAVAAATQGVEDVDGAARHALGKVDLDPDDDRPVSAYSKGMRQRVKVAAALVHEPEMLILDEPLAGLDPLQRRRLIALFHALGDQGRTVIVSSHVLEEVARLGSRVLVIAEGRLAATGDFHELRALMDDRPLRIQIRSDRPRPLAVALLDGGYVSGVEIGDGTVVLETSDVDSFGRAVAGLARDVGARLNEVTPLDDDLDSVFRYLLERR